MPASRPCSSLISAAHPSIAAYPFTTLEPVLGVVEMGYRTFVVAEIPGLIEGAHSGAGLGQEFLRHAERARIFIHLLDGSRPDPLQDLDIINGELRRVPKRPGGEAAGVAREQARPA